MPFIRSSFLGVPKIHTPGFFISTTASMRSAVPSLEHLDQLRARHRIAVQPDHPEPVPGQRKLNIFRGTGVEDVEQHALVL
jgi:hypothetical protein